MIERPKGTMRVLHVCPSCCREFYPTRRTKAQLAAQKFPPCCSMACRGVQQRTRQKGQALTAALAAQRRAYRQRMAAKARGKFGELSVREIEVFIYAFNTGRQVGRQQRWYHQRTKVA